MKTLEDYQKEEIRYWHRRARIENLVGILGFIEVLLYSLSILKTPLIPVVGIGTIYMFISAFNSESRAVNLEVKP